MTGEADKELGTDLANVRAWVERCSGGEETLELFSRGHFLALQGENKMVNSRLRRDAKGSVGEARTSAIE